MGGLLLNDTEILRQNMPSAPSATPTSRVRRRHAGLQRAFHRLGYQPRAGTNLLAVEVHQFTTNPIAADMAFGLEVGFLGNTARRNRCMIHRSLGGILQSRQ